MKLSSALVISYATAGTPYIEESERMLESCAAHGMRVDIEYPAPAGDWLTNINMKGAFVARKLREHNRPLLWLDADSEIVRPLDIEIPAGIDLAYYDMPRGTSRFPGVQGAVLWFAPTEKGIATADRWAELCKEPGPAFDQERLGWAVEQVKPAVLKLPQGCSKIFDRDWFPGEPQVEYVRQHQASRRFKRGVNEAAREFACYTEGGAD